MGLMRFYLQEEFIEHFHSLANRDPNGECGTSTSGVQLTAPVQKIWAKR